MYNFFPLTGGCSEGLGAFRFFFKQHSYRFRISLIHKFIIPKLSFAFRMALSSGIIYDLICHHSRIHAYG